MKPLFSVEQIVQIYIGHTVLHKFETINHMSKSTVKHTYLQRTHLHMQGKVFCSVNSTRHCSKNQDVHCCCCHGPCIQASKQMMKTWTPNRSSPDSDDPLIFQFLKSRLPMHVPTYYAWSRSSYCHQKPSHASASGEALGDKLPSL